MKSNIKPFRTFVNESADLDPDGELRGMGFENRHEIQDSDELEDIVHELFFDDPAVNAAWQEFKTRVHAQIAKFKDEYTWDSTELADLADFYLEAARDYNGDPMRTLIAGNLLDLAEEDPE